MSGPAMDRVLKYGPHENARLMLVLLNVANFADTDVGDRGRWVAQRVVAQRSGISLRWCRELMDQAAADGWLTRVRPARQGRPGLWKLGTNFAATSRRDRERFAVAPYDLENNFAVALRDLSIDGRRKSDGSEVEPSALAGRVSTSHQDEDPISPVALTPSSHDPASWKTHLADARAVLDATRRHPANRNGNGGIIVTSSVDSDTDDVR